MSLKTNGTKRECMDSLFVKCLKKQIKTYPGNERGETVEHIICECKKLAQREYKRRHDTVAKLVHWKLCEKHNLERKEKWYEHCPEGVVEDDDVKLIWDIYAM